MIGKERNAVGTITLKMPCEQPRVERTRLLTLAAISALCTSLGCGGVARAEDAPPAPTVSAQPRSAAADAGIGLEDAGVMDAGVTDARVTDAGPGSADAAAKQSTTTDPTQLDRAFSVYEDAGQLEVERQLAEQQIRANDVVRDAPRIVELERKLRSARYARVQGLLAPLPEHPSPRQLQARKTALEDGLKTLDAVADATLAAQVRAEIDRVDDELTPGFGSRLLGDLGKVGEKALEIFAYVVLAALLLLLLQSLRDRLRRRDGTSIEIEDLTLSPAAATTSESAGKTMAETARSLSSEFTREIRTLERNTSPALSVAGLASRALSEEALGQLASLSSVIDDVPVKIGLVQFSPRALFSYFAALFAPRYEYTLVGALSKVGDRVELWIQKRDRHGQPVAGTTFGATTTGANARTSVIRDVALQFALFQAERAVTRNWRSLRGYLDAEAELTAGVDGDVEQRWQHARELLVWALRCDAGNWLARFRYAQVLDALGDHLGAQDQFDYVARMVDSPDVNRSQHFREFVRREPEFLRLLQLARGMARAKYASTPSGTPEDAWRALEITMNAWPAEPAADERAGQGVPASLLVAHAARASALVAILEHLRRTRDRGDRSLIDPKGITHNQKTVLGGVVMDGKRKIYTGIIGDERWLWDQIEGRGVESWDSYANAHAVAQDALGRAYFLTGKSKDAIRTLRWATQIHVPGASASPFLNLASVIIEEGDKYSLRWAVEARALLDTALKINPSATRAHYLLGRVFAAPSVRQYEQALEHFEKGGDNPATFKAWAQLLIERFGTDKERVRQAIDLLRRSIIFDDWADDRYLLLGKTALDAVASGAITAQDAKERILPFMDTSSREGSTDSLKKSAAGLAQRIRDCKDPVAAPFAAAPVSPAPAATPPPDV